MKIIVKGVMGKKAKRSISKTIALPLLLLYVVGTSQLELLHSLVHDHAVSATYTQEQRTNPCEVNHDYAEQGSDQEAHFIVSDKCHMCDLAYDGDQTLLINVIFVKREFSSREFDIYKRSLDSYWAVISSSRAPPVLV